MAERPERKAGMTRAGKREVGKVGWELRQQRVETAHREGGVLRRKPLWILPAFLGGDKELASSGMASRNLSRTLCCLPTPSLLFPRSQLGSWGGHGAGNAPVPGDNPGLWSHCLGMGAKGSKGRVPPFPHTSAHPNFIPSSMVVPGQGILSWNWLPLLDSLAVFPPHSRRGIIWEDSSFWFTKPFP